MKKYLLVALGFIALLSLMPKAHASILVDTSSSISQVTNTGVIQTNAFTTAIGNELIVAFLLNDGADSGNATDSLGGAGLTWTLAPRAASAITQGSAEVWWAYAPSVLTSQKVNATSSNSLSDFFLKVVAFRGAATSSLGASTTQNFNGVAPSVVVTTTAAGSWVWADGLVTENTTKTAGSNQTLVGTVTDANDGNDYWVQRQNATTSASGTGVTMNLTAPTNGVGHFVGVEILASTTPATSTPDALFFAGD